MSSSSSITRRSFDDKIGMKSNVSDVKSVDSENKSKSCFVDDTQIRDSKYFSLFVIFHSLVSFHSSFF